jgi:RimJ/RimL family protein N-acetyltransferase
MLISAPVLETPRLILRPHVLGDFADLSALWSDPDVTRFLGGGVGTREERWARLLRYFGMWQALGFGFFAITDKTTGEFLGEAGLADFHRDITPSIDMCAEAGWVLAEHVWGKGIATEALAAILHWYASQPLPRPVACIMNSENQASRRVAEKSGFVEVARTEYKGAPTIMFHHRG